MGLCFVCVGPMLQAGVLLPLKERTYHSSSSLLLVPFSSFRPKKYKSWSVDNLHRACLSVEKNELSIRQAVEAYEISTMHDRLSGRVPFGKQSGPARYLSDTEEAELVNVLAECSKVGYARSKKEVLALVQSTMKLKGREVPVSGGWWESFKRRHPQMTLRTAEPLAYARAVASNPVILDRYFDILEQTLTENGIMDKPCQVFNCDETGMPLAPSPPKVVTVKGDKHPYSINCGNRAQITVLSCCSAAGYAIPPLVIFDCKILKPEMADGEVPGTMYGLSSSGWIDSELFDLWFWHHFLVHAPPVRHLLLLLDGHSSHFEPAFLQKVAVEEVIVFLSSATHHTHHPAT